MGQILTTPTTNTAATAAPFTATISSSTFDDDWVGAPPPARPFPSRRRAKLPPIVVPATAATAAAAEYTLAPWFPVEKINWIKVGQLPRAIGLMIANPTRIHWPSLSLNPHPIAVQLLQANPARIHWRNLCRNTNNRAIRYLKTKPRNIMWPILATNSCWEARRAVADHYRCEIAEVFVADQSSTSLFEPLDVAYWRANLDKIPAKLSTHPDIFVDELRVWFAANVLRELVLLGRFAAEVSL